MEFTSNGGLGGGGGHYIEGKIVIEYLINDTMFHAYFYIPVTYHGQILAVVNSLLAQRCNV